jgi:hypothetical protein
MELRQRIVNAVKDLLRSQESDRMKRKSPETETSLWSEHGLDISTPSQIIECVISGNDLCSGDLGTCMSCLASLKRMIDLVGSKGIDAKALPTLTPPAEERLEQCYHKTSLSDVFRFANLGI